MCRRRCATANGFTRPILPDGKKTEDPFAPCRACHAPLTEKKDFVQRYDEYFQKRAVN